VIRVDLTIPGIVLESILHLNDYLPAIIAQYGLWAYGLLFLVIFCETGLVFAPFLPGDSLLFLAGILAGVGSLQPVLLVAVLIVAAILGDSLNYWVGATFGKRILRTRWSIIKEDHIFQTEAFFDRFGGNAIILARFIPYVRTLAPFIAGVVGMRYGTFATYNVIGALVWVPTLVIAGYAIGSYPFLQGNQEPIFLVVALMSAVSVIIVMGGLARLVGTRSAS
jgi:membrane-associated protein